jgi:hypothetical protein
MKPIKTENQSIKELFERRLVEMATKPTTSKKSVKKILNTLEIYDSLNTKLEA